MIHHPIEQKKKVAEILFEQFGVGKLFFGTAPILSSYSFGKTTATILESGYGLTQIACICNGYKIESSMDYVRFASQDVNRQLQQLLKERGIHINSSSREQILDEIKREICSVYKTRQNMKARRQEGGNGAFTLPDGREVELGEETRLAAEVLFTPQLGGFSARGLGDLLYSTVEELGVDLKRLMFKNVVLSGGNLCIP